AATASLLLRQLAHRVEQVRLEASRRGALVDRCRVQLAARALALHVGPHLRVDQDSGPGPVRLHEEGDGDPPLAPWRGMWGRVSELTSTRVQVPFGSTKGVKATSASPSTRSSPTRPQSA